MNQRLREARIRAGYQTQGAAAKALGVPQPKLSDYETGKSFPSPDRARMIARKLETTLADCGWDIVPGPEVVVSLGWWQREEGS